VSDTLNQDLQYILQVLAIMDHLGLVKLKPDPCFSYIACVIQSNNIVMDFEGYTFVFFIKT